MIVLTCASEGWAGLVVILICVMFAVSQNRVLFAKFALVSNWLSSRTNWSKMTGVEITFWAFRIVY